MILSGHQPAYLPWAGFFEKIVRSDIFVFHDTAQFEKGGFLHRNKVKTPDGSCWLTVPVDLTDYLGKQLREIRLCRGDAWQQKHWKTIQMNYSKSPYFARYKDFLYSYYTTPWETLVDLNMAFIRFILQEWNISTMVVYASQMEGVSGKKGDFVLSLCKTCHVDTYYSGIYGKDYLVETDFAQAGIRVVYQKYQAVTYPQMFGSFLPSLSILDILLNCGPASLDIVVKGGSHEYSGCCSPS